MFAIRSYNNTQCELSIEKLRLDYLICKKEKLYSKFFPLTTKITDNKNTGNEMKDKMAEYIHELHKVNKNTGMSLAQEIDEQRNKVNELKYYLKLMEKAFKELSGIEYELYKAIVDKGMSINKAVEKVAGNKNKDVSTIWKYHYPKISKEIKKLKIL